MRFLKWLAEGVHQDLSWTYNAMKRFSKGMIVGMNKFLSEHSGTHVGFMKTVLIISMYRQYGFSWDPIRATVVIVAGFWFFMAFLKMIIGWSE